jgi:hypothetical protein
VTVGWLKDSVSVDTEVSVSVIRYVAVVVAVLVIVARSVVSVVAVLVIVDRSVSTDVTNDTTVVVT